MNRPKFKHNFMWSRFFFFGFGFYWPKKTPFKFFQIAMFGFLFEWDWTDSKMLRQMTSTIEEKNPPKIDLAYMEKLKREFDSSNLNGITSRRNKDVSSDSAS